MQTERPLHAAVEALLEGRVVGGKLAEGGAALLFMAFQLRTGPAGGALLEGAGPEHAEGG